MRQVTFKLNKRIFSVDVDENIEDYDELINESFEEIINQIQSNNETISNIFFEELIHVCNVCKKELEGTTEEGVVCIKCQ